jgi:hypothetical protein
MTKSNSKNWIEKWVRAGVVFTALTVAVVWLAGEGRRDADQAAAISGWGSESVQTLQDGLRDISPIALANACGMGASSCFKCHNGKRAGLASMDPAKSPWHVNHKTVNNSCVGCHQGNPRLMKEDLAHAGMIKAPRSGNETCGSCHKSDQAKVETAYKSIGGGK